LHVVVRNDEVPGDDSFGDYVAEISGFGKFRAVKSLQERSYAVNRWTRRVKAVRLPEATKQCIEQFRSDLFLCFDIASAAMLEGVAPPGTRVVWLGDLNFETFWYHAVYDGKERTASYLRLPLAWFECLQWRRFYREVLADAGCVIDASSSSVVELARLGIESEYLAYPWPVTARYVTTDSVPIPPTPTFLFFGMLTGLGSRSALRFLIDKLYPRALSVWGRRGFTIYICGNRELPRWVADAMRSRPELVFKGFVDDLEDLGRRCHAVLVPIDVPVGNRSRIVTAMAYGWPIVAHTNTARGNPELVSGSNCLLANCVEEFVDHMRLSVENPGAGAALGRAAKGSYSGTFAPEVATAKMLDRLDRTLSSLTSDRRERS
jgi:glycosyltransferase involved in cell wall biosynthesis